MNDATKEARATHAKGVAALHEAFAFDALRATGRLTGRGKPTTHSRAKARTRKIAHESRRRNRS